MDGDKKILDISFEGEGCCDFALASASILTDILKGEKDFNVAKNIIDNFLDLIKENKLITTNGLDDNQKTTLMSLSGVKEFSNESKMCYNGLAYCFNCIREQS